MLGRPHIPRLRPPIQSGPYTPDKPLSSFTVSAPARGCIYYGLKSRYERLREAGYLTGAEIATELGVAVDTVKAWRYKGWLRATAYDDKPHYLYAPLGADPPKKYRWKSGRYGESTPHVTQGAQYEA